MKAANAIATVIILWDKAKAEEQVYKETPASYVSLEQVSKYLQGMLSMLLDLARQGHLVRLSEITLPRHGLLFFKFSE